LTLFLQNLEARMNVARALDDGLHRENNRLSMPFSRESSARGWQTEKNVFKDPENDLVIDFWKRNIGVDVAFNHRSFIGSDLLRLQAAAEVKNIINVRVYICPTKEFAKVVSPKDCTSIGRF